MVGYVYFFYIGIWALGCSGAYVWKAVYFKFVFSLLLPWVRDPRRFGILVGNVLAAQK